MTLFTFGYRGQSFDQFRNKVKDLGAMVIDIRFTPYSKMLPFWTRTNLEKAFGSSYVHLKEFGNRAYKQKGKYDVVDLDGGLDRLRFWLDIGLPCILLCGCENYETCHRRIVSDFLREKLSCDIKEMIQCKQDL